MFSKISTEYAKLTVREMNDQAIGLCKIGQFDKGETIFQKALKKDPSYAYTYYNLMILYRKKKEYNKAIKIYEKLIKIKPDDERAHLLISKVYFEMKDFKKAKEYSKKAGKE